MKTHLEVLNSIRPLFGGHQRVAPDMKICHQTGKESGLPVEEHWSNKVPVCHEHCNCELPERGLLVDNQLPDLLGVHARVEGTT